MSVDRLLLANIQRLTSLHDAEANRRVPPRTFHGWYVFKAEIVRVAAGDIKADPTPENPWHAEAIRPDPVEGKDALTQFFGKIAASASWQARPMSTSDEEFLEQTVDGLC